MCCFGSGNAQEKWNVPAFSPVQQPREPYIKWDKVQMDRWKETRWQLRGMEQKTDRMKETVFTRTVWATQPVEVEERLWLWALGLAASLWKYCEGAEPSLWAIAFRVLGEGGKDGNIEVLRRSWSRAHKGYRKESGEDEHCERGEHGYQEREGTVYQNMTDRQRKQKEKHRLRPW